MVMSQISARKLDTNVAFLKKLPSRKKVLEHLGFVPETTLVIYDKKLEKKPLFAN